jgi:hypothetical protein
MTTPKDELQLWFQYLQDLQVACEQVDTDVSYEDLLTFANDKISTDLSTTDEQDQFIVGAQNSTGLTITTSDLTSSSSFEALLETVWNPLSMFVASFVRYCAPDPYASMSFTDFVQQNITTVFGGGSPAPNWKQLQNGLTSSIPAACYSSSHQQAANGLLSAPNKTIQDLVNLISKMG